MKKYETESIGQTWPTTTEYAEYMQILNKCIT